MTDLKAIVTENDIGRLTLAVADMGTEEVLYYRSGYDTGTELSEDVLRFTCDPASWAEWIGNQLGEVMERVWNASKYLIQNPKLREKAYKEALKKELHDCMHGDMDGYIKVVAEAYKDGEITMWTGEMDCAAMEALLDMRKTPRVSEYRAVVTEDNAGRLYFTVTENDEISYISTHYEGRGPALKEDVQAFIKDPACWKEWDYKNDMHVIKEKIWKDVEEKEKGAPLSDYERREMFYAKLSVYAHGDMEGEFTGPKANGLKVVAEVNKGGAYTLKIHEMGLSSKEALLSSPKAQAADHGYPTHKAGAGSTDKYAQACSIAKKHLGNDAIVTSAIPGRTYGGKIIGTVGDGPGPGKITVQAISDNHAILHHIMETAEKSGIGIGEDVRLTADGQGYSIIQSRSQNQGAETRETHEKHEKHEKHVNNNEPVREGTRR